MYSEKYLSSCRFAQAKAHIDCPGIELGRMCSEAEDRHCVQAVCQEVYSAESLVTQ